MANEEKSFDDSHTYHETDIRPVIDFRWNPTIKIECLTKLDQNLIILYRASDILY